MNRKSVVSILLVIVLLSFKGVAQLSITGAGCVVPGTTYKYIFSNLASGATSMQVCLTGGIFTGGDSTCYNGTPVSYVTIIWNSAAAGSISVSGSAGAASLNVNKAIVFSGGKIDSLLQVQAVNPGWIPLPLNCTDAKGGSCSPMYAYQWQESADGLHWTDIANATSKQLKFFSSPSATVYYRRKATETVSHSENYSDIAVVYPKPGM